MSVWRLVLGVFWLAFGLAFILGRDRIQARQVRRLGRAGQHPMLSIVLGSMYVLLGVLWLVSAVV